MMRWGAFVNPLDGLPTPFVLEDTGPKHCRSEMLSQPMTMSGSTASPKLEALSQHLSILGDSQYGGLVDQHNRISLQLRS